MASYWQEKCTAIFVAVGIVTSKISLATADEFVASAYTRNASLSADLDVFWTIDTDLETIYLAVHAKKASGWAGLGLSEMGGMDGADIVYYEAATGNITDAHSIIAGMPVTDECTQDWTLTSATIGTDGLVFEANRALQTNDSQDRVFADDSAEGASPTTLIAAWGDSESISYHYTSFVQGQVIMFGGVENSNYDSILELTSSQNVSSFDVTTKNFTIPADRTWYEDTCISASELPALDEYHVIGFEAILQNSTSEYVHHLVLIAYTGTDNCGQDCAEFFSDSYYDTNSSSAPSYVSTENGGEIPSFCDYDFAYIHAWTPGIADEQLPEDVGFRFGSASGGYTSLVLQTHYNNIDGDEGVTDSSGVRVYYTDTLRSMDMGVLALGDPSVYLEGKSISEGKSSVSFECPGSCTEANFEVENVTVFSHFLHMHENGQRMITRQYRKNESGNEVLVHSAEVEYYSFLQAGGYVYKANNGMTIQKGDRFETDCLYDTALSSISPDDVKFGLGSEDEMCIDYLYYYPNQDVPYGSCGLGFCDGNITGNLTLDVDSNFNRTFGISTPCDEEVEEQVEEGEQSSSASSLPGVVKVAIATVATVALAGI